MLILRPIRSYKEKKALNIPNIKTKAPNIKTKAPNTKTKALNTKTKALNIKPKAPNIISLNIIRQSWHSIKLQRNYTFVWLVETRVYYHTDYRLYCISAVHGLSTVSH